jgi:ABC-2 type transport system ATP-binding protein
MAEIEFCRIFKTYDPGLFKKKVRAIEDLSFKIIEGEIFGLIGPNGAGKSTTIRLLLGLIRPDSGAIHFRGKPLPLTPIQREIGYLPENPYLYDHLTLNELLTFSGRASGLTSQTTGRRGNELMEKLKLGDARKRPLRTFSKGMLQRAGICFALLHDPTVVILDEPMSGLDPVGRRMVFDLVMELKNQGKTVFFCSHILSDVERLCDRIGVMVGGQLVKEYEKKEFWQGDESTVHLVVSPLSESQRRGIAAIATGIAEERAGNVVSLRPSCLRHATEYFAEAGIEIRASRTERFSLEEIFMQVVGEQK